MGKSKSTRIQKCLICDTEFPTHTSGKFCSKECINQNARNSYLLKQTSKLCKICGNEFLGVRRQTNCPGCRYAKPTEYESYQQDILCRVCGQKIGERTKKHLKGISTTAQPGKTCQSCKDISNTKRVLHMESDLNPSIVKYGRNTYEPLSKEEVSEVQRVNISGDKNPMRRPEVREKVRATLKERYKTTPCIKGKDHWLWKGNRIPSQTIRTRLYKVWVLPILELDGFMCAFCRTKVNLEVHHVTKPFREVLEQVLSGRILSSLSAEDFEIISDTVLDLHNDIEGITLCVDCHRLVDDHRY